MDSNTHSTQPTEPLAQLEPPAHREPPQWLEPPAHPEPTEQEPPELPEWLEGPADPEPEWPPEWLEGTRDPERLGWPERPELPEELAELAAVVDQLAGQELERLSGPARIQRAGGLRWLVDRLEGQWLKELAGLDAAGAAATDPKVPAPSTASWLRRRLRMGAGAAHDAVRTARALFRGPLTETAEALTSGQLSPAHARVLAQGTRQLADQVAADAEPVLLEAARRLDPPLLRQAVGYLVEVAAPAGAEVARQRRHERRGLWLTPTIDNLVAVDGLLEPEAGAIVQAALEPLARPADAEDARSADQRTADALTEVCRRSLEGGGLRKAGGVRPQLLVTVDLDSLLGRPGGLGGDTGWAGPLDAEACRRLAFDGSVTRVLVSRQPGDPPSVGARRASDHSDPGTDHDPGADHDPGPIQDLPGRLRAAMALLPPTLGGPPPSPWTSAAAAGSSPPPNGPPWLSGTGVVSSRAVSGPYRGATAIICGTGWTAAGPTWRIWPWCAGPIIGACMRAAGS